MKKISTSTHLLSIAIFLIICTQENLYATGYLWDGTVGDWNDPSKWIPNGVPGPGDDVTLEYSQVSLTGNVTIASLTMIGHSSLFGTQLTRLVGTGNMSVTGNVISTGGVSPENTGNWNISGNLDISGGGWGLGGTVTIEGLTTIHVGINIHNNFTLNGGGLIENDASIGIRNNATLLIPSGKILTIVNNNTNGPVPWGNNGGYLNNYGSIVKTGNGHTLISNVEITNYGQIDIEQGVFQLNQNGNAWGASNHGLITIQEGASLNIDGFFTNTGTIKGKGFWNFQYIQIWTNTGTVAPGLSPGTLHILGNYKNGTLTIEMENQGGVTSTDLLEVDGNIDLTGSTLQLTPTGTIPFGNYDIISYTGSRTGSFATANLPCGMVLQYDDANKKVKILVFNAYPGATELCNGLDDNCDGIVDNVITCPKPTGTVSTNITFNAATISWSSLPCATSYQYRYRHLISQGNWSSWTAWFSSSGPPVNLTGLLSNTTYQWNVRAICGNKASATASQSFSTCIAYTHYADTDADSFGNPVVSIMSCSAIPPTGYSSNGLDCDDNNPAFHPGATDICDGLDNDCDGLIAGDEGTVYYQDADVDGYGNLATATASCIPLSGYVGSSNDCNDAASDIYPGAIELCDGIDNNCDTITDNVTICPKPTGLTSSNVMMTTAIISWNALPCAVNGYQYRLRSKTGGVWSAYGPWIAVASNSTNLTGLIPSTIYQYQLRAVCYGNKKSTTANSPNFMTQGAALISNNSNASSPPAYVTNIKNDDFQATVFPNPSTGKFITGINTLSGAINMELVVTDCFGKELKQFNRILEKGNNQIEIDLTGFPDAMYYIRLRTEKSSSYISVVKTSQ